jgi:hypothetical protein
VRFDEVPENLGIVGGVRACLERADGDYVVPLDADDLLTPDALAVLAREALARGRPAMLYSDEDLLVEGEPRSPYLRPDWDPALNLAGSYVWHLCAIARERALVTGLYSDRGAEYCHDWDTMFRIWGSGGAIEHVPEVLYHWRTHPASQTNRAGGNQASLASQRQVLERFLGGTPRPELYRVAPFPLDRGAPEWWIERLPREAPPVAVVLLPSGGGGDLLDALVAAEAPPVRSVLAWAGAAPGPVPPGLEAGLRRVDGGLDEVLAAAGGDAAIAFVADSLRFGSGAWLWEAIGLLELLRPAAVGGRVIDGAGRVSGGGGFWGYGGPLGDPDAGRMAEDPGWYSTALKTRTVDAPDSRLAVVSASLAEAMRALPRDLEPRLIGPAIGALAHRAGGRVVRSPLVAGRAATVMPQATADDISGLLRRLGVEQPRSRWYSRHFRRDRPYELALAAGAAPAVGH